jgi:hypothetical protein
VGPRVWLAEIGCLTKQATSKNSCAMCDKTLHNVSGVDIIVEAHKGDLWPKDRIRKSLLRSGQQKR